MRSYKIGGSVPLALMLLLALVQAEGVQAVDS
ncbi:hypothetical protein BBR47_58740 [Brevibacillus brevis NBRC 100599]|uniref:Uncharacterized protein n=1 Tax=Brevibacillus brevis (strain 47 / JCM 6285 / NBRC 100599) TaxID=358681 RepID=C0Z9Z7_BREBN|nr:hypothetical protein BBR47_58740 [Brevibacillus brevis NBRC 100599]